MTNFFNWETAPVHPVSLSPDGQTLAVCNLPDDRVELFTLTNGWPVSLGSVTVGLDPVTARFRTATELWVVNYISSSISIVDVPTVRVMRTVIASNEPSDLVFAGASLSAFISCGGAGSVEVLNATNYASMTNITLAGLRPKSMDVSPDGSRVYVAFFESGNASTIISSPIAPLLDLPHDNAVDLPFAPSHGLNPPPNAGTNFVPAINPAVSSVMPPPRVSLIVKRNGAGRWMDDNGGDWTEYITGTNAAFTGRMPGWDMPDHDLAIINSSNYSVNYAAGIMNICMAVGVNPVTGQVAVVGTDAINEVRFQPVLNGIFVRVEMGLVNPASLAVSVSDLNPHLDYMAPSVTNSLLSIGDPRGIVWSADGSTGYVSGMGSSNIVLVNASGDRLSSNSLINVGQGPTGMALDNGHGHLYVYNRFDSTLSVVSLSSNSVVTNVPLFNPTPSAISAGRPVFYDTHMTSGLGQASCASCHVDGRTDRLAWDLGDPTSTIAEIDSTFNIEAPLPAVTNNYHPMKGPMTTLTLQNIIGHEPFHWRGDREGIEQFVITFTNLQGMPLPGVSSNQMSALKTFLGTIGYPPNPYRNFDNSLATNIALPGQVALGRGLLPAGAQLPNGNALRGLGDFETLLSPGGCTICHALPAGLGPDMEFEINHWVQFPIGTNDSHHVALVQLPRSNNLPLKIPQLRNLFDKVGFSFSSTNSLAGFGFSHDGAVDSLPRFLQDSFLLTNDQTTADLTAFLFSITGSDLPNGSVNNANFAPGLSSLDVPAATGFQLTLTNSIDTPALDSMLARANAVTSRVDLIVKGFEGGLPRGWFYHTNSGLFQSDRMGETESPAALRALAGAGSEQTYTLVPAGCGERIGIDRDADGFYDRDELDYGSDPANAQSTPFNSPPQFSGLAFNGPGFQLTWRTFPGISFQLQYDNSLNGSAWSNVAPAQIAATNIMSFTDTNALTNAARFYRLIASP